MELCDEDLAVLLATNLNEYFEQLVSVYYQKLYAFARGLLGDPQDAEEIVQDSFLNAYGALVRYSTQDVQTLKLRPWLYKITLNLSRNHRDRRGKHHFQSVSLDTPAGRELFEETERGRYGSPDTEVEQNEFREEMYARITELPRLYREPISLHYLGGFQYREIADLLNQPVNTVKSNARRGIQKLNKTMAKLVKEEVR